LNQDLHQITGRALGGRGAKNFKLNSRKYFLELGFFFTKALNKALTLTTSSLGISERLFIRVTKLKLFNQKKALKERKATAKINATKSALVEKNKEKTFNIKKQNKFALKEKLNIIIAQNKS